MVHVAHSIELNSREAVAELQAKFGEVRPKVILCFSSTKQEPHELVHQLHNAYRDALICGCTTAGEIVSGKSLKGSVVAMALETDTVEKVASVVIQNLGPTMDLDGAIKALELHMGASLDELDPDHHVGLVITDGLSGAEERLIESIAEKTEIAFIGGSAGDDLKFQKTQVFLGKGVFENAAILVLMKVPKGFNIIKTQSFKMTGKVLEATQVDEASRTILSFNHKPAVEAYAEALGVSPESVADHFMTYPLARMVAGEPYVRSPQMVQGTAIKFYCRVQRGEMLALMQATDILSDTKKAVTEGLAEKPGAQGIIDFHCILRALELESKGLSQDYGALFNDVPTIGFCTYGEAWTTHINQTSTMLVL